MVLLFQSAQGLAQDAIVGPLTWKQLIEFDLQL
jgi:peptidoglycan hydrolase-like protein with peptidoglycan-binding domain